MPVPAIPSPPLLFSDVGQPVDNSRGSNFLRLNWLVASDVRESDIRFVDSATGIENIRSNVTPSSTFIGLTQNTRYRVAVRARNDDGTSNFSSEFIVLTRPPTPNLPRLADSDEKARGFDFLQLAWDSVGTQFEYDLRFNQVTELRNQTSGNAISSLPADTVHSIEVRARDATTNNSSFWSNSFVTITRPLTPASLQVPVTQPFIPSLVIEWELPADAGSFIQLRQKIREEETIVVPRGELKQSLTLQNYEYGIERHYAIRLVTLRSQAPNGLNESFWSPDMAIFPTIPLGLFDAIETSKYAALNIFNKFPKIS
jgi:hypothetical protein